MKLILPLVLLLVSVMSFGQQPYNCDCGKMLPENPYFTRATNNTGGLSGDSLQFDYYVFQKCGNFDAVDKRIISPAFLSAIAITLLNNGEAVTYGNVLKQINDYKGSVLYKQERKMFITSDSIGNEVASPSGFEKYKKQLVNIGILDSSEVKAFGSFLRDHQSQDMTYKEAFQKYTQSVHNTAAHSGWDEEAFKPLVTLDNAVTQAKKENKRVLLYFSGHANISSRKMEDNILSDSVVKNILTKDFICFIAYADDHSMNEQTHTTKGKYYLQIQNKKFKTFGQPYFCIIDNHQHVLAEINYTEDVKVFINFLKTGE